MLTPAGGPLSQPIHQGDRWSPGGLEGGQVWRRLRYQQAHTQASRGGQGLGSFCTWCSSVVRLWLPSPNHALSMASPNPTLDAWSFITLCPCRLSAGQWAASAFYSILAGCSAAVHPSLLHRLRVGWGAGRLETCPSPGSHSHSQTAGVPSRQSGSCYTGRRPGSHSPGGASSPIMCLQNAGSRAQ